ncbi:MAG: radical SAM protein [bacterium]|nr:radical SAM protein [bacterium]
MTGVVTLIIPPSPFLLDERVFPFLGILKIAAVLEATGRKVEMLDLAGYSNYLDAVRDHVASTESTHFGITATTPQIPAAALIAEAIKSVRPQTTIILGGPHATLVVASYRREQKTGAVGRAHRAYERLLEQFDVIVAGDGEETIFEALKPESGRLIDADDRHHALWQTSEKLDYLPFPARHLIDMESYHYQIEGKPATSLIAQLGCPYECNFCGGRFSPMLRHIRTRSTEHIIAEIEAVHRVYGHTGFMFYDDELNVNPNMIELMNAIERLQEKLGVEFRLRGFIKSERFTDAQAAAMYAAGFRWILVGFESGSPRILTNIVKKATREANTRCVAIAKRHGLKVKALMSLGHPGESVETIGETRDWLTEARPDDFDATIITTYPGTHYYDLAVETGRPGEWVFAAKNGDRLYQREVDYTLVADYYKGRPDEGYVSHVWTDHLFPEDLVRERDQLEHEVRVYLDIPFNPSAAAQLYEHSMGQTSLPPRIFRSSQ